ncbi:MAG: gamma-glutamyl-gamma-aminobutyrate hydrolase family protein [Halanaeroarchaeum sp.]
MRVVFVDNFDSFTYNLVEYVSDLRIDGVAPETTVLTNTAALADVRDADPDAIVVSPGPGHPENDSDVGVSVPVVRDLARDVPTLGVCLGMEAMVYAYGGRVGHAPEPVHGKAAPIDHDGRGIFAGIEDGFDGARYHSLAAVEVPSAFTVSATTQHAGETLPMAIRHDERPLVGVQFHPESVLTAVGHDVVENFLVRVAD